MAYAERLPTMHVAWRKRCRVIRSRPVATFGFFPQADNHIPRILLQAYAKRLESALLGTPKQRNDALPFEFREPADECLFGRCEIVFNKIAGTRLNQLKITTYESATRSNGANC
jgi:hypothetical protein